jgi:hypothetical protein
VVGPSPRSGETEAPPRSRLSLSSEVKVESEPQVGRGGDRLPRPRLCPSPRVGRGGVRRPASRLSPSPGVGRGGDRLPKPRSSPSPRVGRGKVHLPRPRRGPSPGVGEAELPMAPEAGLSYCQPHSVKWHSSRSDAGGAAFLSGRSVERRSDCGHFGSVD